MGPINPCLDFIHAEWDRRKVVGLRRLTGRGEERAEPQTPYKHDDAIPSIEIHSARSFHGADEPRPTEHILGAATRNVG